MKIFFILISLISFLFIPSDASAQTAVSIQVAPSQVNYKDDATVKVTNIPYAKERIGFELTVYRAGGNGIPVATLSFDSPQQFDGVVQPEECSINQTQVGAMWQNVSCPKNASNGGFYTLQAKLDTEKLDFNAQNTDGTQGVLYEVNVVSARSSQVFGQFYVNPTTNPPEFSIARVDTETTQDVTSAKPGDSLRLFIKNGSSEKQYKIGIEGSPESEYTGSLNCRLDGIKNAPDKSCMVVVDVPKTLTKPFTIYVTDTQTNKTAKRTMQLTTEVNQRPTSTPLSVTPQPTPTPTVVNSPSPTYRPPKPPCAEGLEEGVGDEAKTTVCTKVRTGLGVDFDTSATGFVSFLFTFLLSLSGSILLLVIIYSGYQMMTSRGDQEKIKVARERITSAVVGFLFLIFSLVILEVIGVDILRIPGFCGNNDTTCPNISQPSPTPFPTLEPRTEPVIDKPNGPN